MKTQSRRFRRWLAHLAWTELGKVVPSEALRSAMQVIDGKALFDGPMYELSVRLAWRDGTILYDLGDGRGVRIGPRGWEIEEKPPIIFRRLPHQEPQVAPVRGGRVEELLDFTNLPREAVDDRVTGDRLLAIVYPVIALVVGIVHVVLAIHGVQGSAKSTLMRVYKKLIDPSLVGLLSVPDSLREFVQVCSHHWVLYLDNLASLPGWLSDALCRASTGEAFSKRELYTNDNDVIYSYKRAVGLNGINLAASKPDLLDRCLILELERVERFESESQFWARFEEARPRILGAMFTALSEAMKIVDSVVVPSRLRLVDYVRWGCAVSEVLGYGKDAFLEAFRGTQERQLQEALDASPVARAIIAFMEKPDSWEGTPSELLKTLNETAERINVDTKARAWPKDTRWVWRRINEVRPNLAQKGIMAERVRGVERKVGISKVGENDVNDVDVDALDIIDIIDIISPSLGEGCVTEELVF